MSSRPTADPTWLHAAAPALALAATLCLSNCKDRDPAPESPSGAEKPVQPVATIGPDDALPATAPPATSPAVAFDAASVRESQAWLPPFPLLKPPQGLHDAPMPSNMAGTGFEYMQARGHPMLVEGRVHRARYALSPAGARAWTPEAFARHYAREITALGGIEIGRETPSVTFPPTTCEVCLPHTYLIRQRSRVVWIEVASQADRGELTVVEQAVVDPPH
ncbi:hypothetical protein [Montanilutibacter psychrotolerans]|uniref:Uncharacterized protein n=1 Tax=Montanilutibacter psychrotolerans TaxID=1327343 RepID=A0A3M8SLH2_9GAMM|nr:hypothetical protein [Lysobacter psychrotolerans]RNF82198.1 hypothetical protein EER27_14865 [Lysobacter psychrotolerans]